MLSSQQQPERRQVDAAPVDDSSPAENVSSRFLGGKIWLVSWTLPANTERISPGRGKKNTRKKPKISASPLCRRSSTRDTLLISFALTSWHLDWTPQDFTECHGETRRAGNNLSSPLYRQSNRRDSRSKYPRPVASFRVELIIYTYKLNRDASCNMAGLDPTGQY